MRIIDRTKRKIEKHIDYCEYMIGLCKRKVNHKRTYYFKKQIEVARKRLKINKAK